MQYVARLPEPLKIYFNKKVYSPEYSSIDTILVVDKLLKDGGKQNATVLDVGCGSGIIGLGIKKKNPFIDATLCDISSEAIKVAKLNSKRLGLSVTAYEADLVPTVGQWDIIAANLPTYSDDDMEQELHGPESAYYAGEYPLFLYKRLFSAARERCKALVCECQEKYQEPFLKLAKEEGWTLILSTNFAFAFLPKSI